VNARIIEPCADPETLLCLGGGDQHVPTLSGIVAANAGLGVACGCRIDGILGLWRLSITTEERVSGAADLRRADNAAVE
jgi:hypothetical protein